MNQYQFWQNTRQRRLPDHPAVAQFVRPKIELIEKDIGTLNGLKVLDVGCGNGYFTFWFEKKCDVTGLDFSTRMLELNPCAKKIHGEAENLPFTNNSFDLVFCSNLLHHLKDPTLAVKEMARVSKKFVVILEPNRNNPLMFLFSLLYQEERNALKYSKKYLTSLIVQNTKGDIIRATTCGKILPNKTPKSMLPFLEKLPENGLGGFYNLVIAKVK